MKGEFNMFIHKNEKSGQELAYSELLNEIANNGPLFVDDEEEEESDSIELED